MFELTWAKNGTPDTLGADGDDIDITDLTAYKFNQFMSHTLSTAARNHRVTYDNNGATDYAWRQSIGGATDNTATSQQYTNWNNGIGGSDDAFTIVYVLNIDGEEKLEIGYHMTQNGTGAASAPYRREFVSKVDTTTNTGQFTRIDMTNSGAGDYLTNSNLSALGTD
jgi:hypothetical protein